MLKTIFFGNPDCAVPFLEKLAEVSRVVGVVTSPDEPAGRGQALAFPAVKQKAIALGLPVAQPVSLQGEASAALTQRWGPVDVGVAVAYGKMIPDSLLQRPRLGMVNVHFSLLPRYRGAAPVQWALVRGERETGVTLFRLVKELDAGPVFLSEKRPILPTDNAATLRAGLVETGVGLLVRALTRFAEGPWEPAAQSGEPSLAPSLKKEDGRIDWRRHSAGDVMNRVRGLVEWPVAWARLGGRQVKILEAAPRSWVSGAPGEIVGVEPERGLLVKCSTDAALLVKVKPEGRNVMDGAAFWNGARLKIGDTFDV